ncbi:hypothetical protein [Photobacterium sp. TY1-4]|uniref:hypothetical protein n=1 Tax=Photobacterium sp. TY1-4 TaxID=2899122 RepID=UPI0021BF37F9|nr:hypothetical protein [Photobacterium sp. TY1-4]UXI03023.1 hypothetical protein NH461_21490 [Photobacterium sp. TY1-4]
MFAKHRSYVLAKKTHPKAQVTVNPTETLHIDVKDEKKALEGDFEDLLFKKNGKVTALFYLKHGQQKMPGSVVSRREPGHPVNGGLGLSPSPRRF